MWSEFLVLNPPRLDKARHQLMEHGYDAGCGTTYRGPIPGTMAATRPISVERCRKANGGFWRSAQQ
ncbi:MAG: hypothetical protein H0V07_00365 [Propionibacteriales bacterium]|nr:hypothetical protein [Propionibacteriales bacterium]